MDLELDGNAALVTASSSGLGKASAKALAHEGVDVLVNGRDEDRLDEAVSEIESVATADAEVVGQQADITVKEDVEGLVDRAVEEFGGLDHLVTSAGGPTPYRPLEADDEEWYYAYDLLVMSVVRTVRAAQPTLSEDGGGTVVNITSRSVKEVIDDLVLSNSVRRAVIGLMKTLSHEFAPDVRVNAVMPGAHETSRIEELVEQGVERGDYPDYEAGLDDWSEGIPLERVGDPAELGEAVAWLSSERASYINGAAVPVDGGSTRSV